MTDPRRRFYAILTWDGDVYKWYAVDVGDRRLMSALTLSALTPLRAATSALTQSGQVVSALRQ